VNEVCSESNRYPTSGLGTSHRRRGRLMCGRGLPIRPSCFASQRKPNEMLQMSKYNARITSFCFILYLP